MDPDEIELTPEQIKELQELSRRLGIGAAPTPAASPYTGEGDIGSGGGTSAGGSGGASQMSPSQQQAALLAFGSEIERAQQRVKIASDWYAQVLADYNAASEYMKPLLLSQVNAARAELNAASDDLRTAQEKAAKGETGRLFTVGSRLLRENPDGSVSVVMDFSSSGGPGESAALANAALAREKWNWERSERWPWEKQQAELARQYNEEQAQAQRQLQLFGNLGNLWQQAAQYQVAPGQTYYRGFQPGGPYERLIQMAGGQYSPEQYRVATQQFDPAALWRAAAQMVGR